MTLALCTILHIEAPKTVLRRDPWPATPLSRVLLLHRSGFGCDSHSETPLSKIRSPSLACFREKMHANLSLRLHNIVQFKSPLELSCDKDNWVVVGCNRHELLSPESEPDPERTGGGKMIDEAGDIQVRFMTRDSQVEVPGEPISVPLKLNTKGLSEIVNALAGGGEDEDMEDQEEEEDKKDLAMKGRKFDFLIDGEFLRGTLAAYAKSRLSSGAASTADGSSSSPFSLEKVLVLEYTESMPPPNKGPIATHPDWVSALHCSTALDGLPPPPYALASGCYDGCVRVYTKPARDAFKRPPDAQVALAAAHSKPIKAVHAFHTHTSDKNSTHQQQRLFVASGSQDQTVRIWKHTRNSSSGDDGDGVLDPLCLLKSHTSSVECLAVIPTPQRDRLVSSGFDRQILIWKLPGLDDNDDEERKESTADAAAAPSKKRRTETGTTTDTTAKYVVDEPSTRLEGAMGPVLGICWPHPFVVYACGFDRQVRMWDVKTGVNSLTLPGQVLEAMAAATSISFGLGSNLIATGHTDKTVCLWDPRKKGKSVMKMRTGSSSHKGFVTDVSWCKHSSHKLASTSHDGTLKVPHAKVQCSADTVAMTELIVRPVWDARARDPLHTIKSHDGKGLCVDWWGPSMLATGGSDNRIAAHLVNFK
eukprot:jgi/Bigna1/79288/fgenesh1_pg.61_\